MEIKKITIENFKNLTSQMLLDESKFFEIEQVIYDIEAGGSPDEADKALIIFDGVIRPVADQNPIIFKKYLPLLAALRLMSLSQEKDEDKARFFDKNLITLLNQPYADVLSWLKSIFLFYDYEEKISRDFQNLLISIVSQNNNFIGDKDIRISLGIVKPSVKNWIYDYNASSSSYQSRKSVAEETGYVNQSANAKLLDQAQRTTLLKLLRLYDWLRFEALLPVRTQENPAGPKLGPNPQPARVPSPPVAPISKPVFSDFEKKLAQVAAPVPHGQDLEVLRRKMEKQGEGRRAEGAQQIKMTPDEIKREVAEKELPAHKAEIAASSAKVATAAGSSPPRPTQINEAPRKDDRQEIQTQSRPVVPRTGLQSLNDIRVSDDLKKIELAHLRTGALYNQIQTIKNKILQLAQANRVLPYYTVNAFEQSPLFKLYLSVGDEVIHDNNPDRGIALKNAVAHSGSDLTLQEFEVIADLKKEIERL